MKQNFKIFYNSILISLLILALYGQHSFLHKYLGHVSPFMEVELLNVCNEIFCRGIIYNLFIFVFYNLLGNNLIIILFQIFLFVFCTFKLVNQMNKSGVNKYLLYIFLLFIFLNPRLIKYSFNFGDEAVLIPLIIIYFTALLKFLSNRSYGNYITINVLTVLLYLTKSGTAPIILTTTLFSFFLNYNIKKKIIFLFLPIFSVIIFHQITSNIIGSDKNIKNYYLHIHLLSSTIAKSSIIENNNSNLDQLINKKIYRKNIIRDQIGGDFKNKIFFKCVIFPALNNYIYEDNLIRLFFKNKKNYNDIQNLPFIYLRNFLGDPINFISHYLTCTYSNFIFIEFINQKNYEKNLELMDNQNLTKYEKKIINSFIINSQPYFKILLFARIFGILTLIIIHISFFISLRNVVIKKTDSLDIFNLFVFFTYMSIIFIHVNIVHSQSRWFFSYLPLAMISSTIFLNKLLNLIRYKKKY